MWLSKPVYESIPYFYLIAGLCALAASLYLDYGYWPTLCFSVGIGCLVAGLVVYLRRRDFRRQSQQVDDSELLE
ncbi:MAG: hypothetical protein AAFX58_09640 [Pseudomonadota bacterium]